MSQSQDIPSPRLQNPFSIGLSTELFEDPNIYKQAFSERILVSETLSVFQQVNVILVGPQGSGKSMILNLLRYKVLTEFLKSDTGLPHYLEHCIPFLGISINLTRASFHAFGRRSISKASFGTHDPEFEINCASDFLAHYLFREFMSALSFLCSEQGTSLRQWHGISHLDDVRSQCRHLSEWEGWAGYYSNCITPEGLLQRCETRLNSWRRFLAGGRDFPQDVIHTMAPLQDAIHAMGNAFRSLNPSRGISLYVVIDQYEELIGLNSTGELGTELLRVVNTLIKSRDPVVFYKMGVRTYDWGRELRVTRSDAKVEKLRDYLEIDLASVLIRTESTAPERPLGNQSKWLFAQLAEDVAVRRLKVEGALQVSGESVRAIFGPSSASAEAVVYLKSSGQRQYVTDARVPKVIKDALVDICNCGIDSLDLQLALGWAQRFIKLGSQPEDIASQLGSRPWRHKWWRKERKEIALVQLASSNFQRRRLSGWNSVLLLSGANISAFLLIFSEIWDYLVKHDVEPLKLPAVTTIVQSDAIFAASRKWLSRENQDNDGGARRFVILGRLGSAIRQRVLEDRSMSNPGHTGFSLRDADLVKEGNKEIAEFLHSGVKWGVLEMRQHRSKQKSDGPRTKWYLHPLLAPVFEIPFTRVKEPLYVNDIEIVKEWIFGDGRIRFSATGTNKNVAARREEEPE